MRIHSSNVDTHALSNCVTYVKVNIGMIRDSLLFCLPVIFATKTIIISSDGFRWDYYGRFETPGLDRIREKGVHVKNLANSFATVTFPNHYTLATGLYEESHGIVDNEMYDPVFNESFTMQTVDPKWWNGAEPIWVVSERVGKKAVCVNWVGCAIEGLRPTYWNEYKGELRYEDRVDRVVEKLSDDAELALLYFEDPDHTCHMFGPDSDELAEAIARVDSAVQYLLTKLDLETTNIIFTSDHGGYSVSKDRLIVLQEYSQMQFSLAANGAVAHVWPSDDPAEAVDELVEHFKAIDPRFAKCYRKEFVPRRLHYSENRRIAPIVCIAELGWSLVHTLEDAEKFRLKGSHGYDSSLDENSPMRPVFLAAGPDFITTGLRGTIMEPFENVHIFPLLAELLRIPTEKLPSINGTLHAVESILKRGQSAGSFVEQLLLASGFTASLAFVLATI